MIRKTILATDQINRRASAMCLAWKAWAMCVLALLCASAGAQDYPNRPIRLIVPYVAGAGVDHVARLLVPKLSQALNQQVVIENRAGAGGIIGMEAVAKAEPDGYTIGMGDPGPLAINRFIYSQLSYDPIKDFAPVVFVATLPTVLVAHPRLQISTLPELLDLARKQPGKISYASSGLGTSNYLAMELLKSQAGIDLLHVPYKGSAPAMAGVMSGEPPLIFVNLMTAGPLIDAGKLRAVAIASAQRSPSLPNLPTVAESGVPGYELETWFGIIAPIGTPRPIVERLNREFRKVLDTPEIRERLMAQGAMQAGGGSPEKFGEMIAKDNVRYGELVRQLGIKPQ